MLSCLPATANDPAFCESNKKSRYVAVTCYQFQKKLRQLISLSGRDEMLYSSHSLRRGGCSCAFKSNVKSELIQLHGDWLSDCYKEYLTYRGLSARLC